MKKSNLKATIYGIGINDYNGKVMINSKFIKSYRTWYDMLGRCYNEKIHQKRQTYIGCKVCDEWLYFSNFKKWYDKNYYNIDDERMELDKDILHKGNKIYSPETCVFVPQNINSLFTKRNLIRGILPIGVYWDKQYQKYRTQCNNGKKGKTINLGRFNTPEEAFNIYKNFKENIIKEVADKYNNKIPQKLYDAMYKYKVEITD